MSRDDTDMKNIRQCLLSGDWNQLLNKQYLTVKQELSAVGDIVLRGTRLVIPRQMRDQIRYHCPVIGFINYPKTPTKPFTRKIWLYEHADYEKLRHNLINVNWDSLFLTDDIELITNDITNAILSAAESSIPSKIVTIRKGGPKWLSCNIRKMIRQKNGIHRKAKHFNNPMHWNKFRKIRNGVTSLVRNAKDKYNNDLIKNITNMNSSCKNWWNIVK